MDINQILQFEADNQRIPVFLLVFLPTQKAEFLIFFDLPKKILRIFFNYVFLNATVCLHVITYQKKIIIVHEKARIPQI